MAKTTHSTRNDAGDFDLPLTIEGRWPIEYISIGILADIRRELRAINQRAPRRDLELQEMRRALRQLNKRLRDHGLKIKARPDARR